MTFVSHCKAVLYKSLFLQMRQTKTNVAQIVVPVFFLLFYGYFNLQFGSWVISYTYEDVDGARTWYPNSYSGTSMANGTYIRSQYYVKGIFADAPKGDSAGSLTNETIHSTSNTGLLGHFPQWWYYDYQMRYDMHYVYQNTPVVAPSFQKLDNADDMDENFYEIGKEQIRNYYSDSYDDVDYLVMPTVGLVFHELEYDKGKLDYTLQYDPDEQYEDILPSFLPNDLFWTSDKDDSTPQFVMNMVNSGFASVSLGYNVTIWSQATTMKSNQTDTNFFNFLPLLGFLCIPPSMAFLLPVIVFQVVLEKSHGQLEMAKLKGLSMTAYYISNYVFYFTFTCILSIVAYLVGELVNAPFIVDSWTVSIPLFLLWGLCQVSLGMVFAAFFTSERNATIVSYLVVFVSIGAGICLNIFVFAKKAADWWYHLFPPFTFVRGVFLLQNSYVNSEPLTFTKNWNPEMLSVFLILIGQAIIMLLVTIYLDLVIPRNFGYSEPLYFPITWLWRVIMRKKEGTTVELQEVTGMDDIQDEDEDCYREREKVINCTSGSDYTVLCKRMRKEYGSHAALKSFCISIEPGETFGLLGPNGAGKTTLISCLCGMNTPTSGHAIIDGHDTVMDMSAVRKVLGYCPQHDILWDDLTIMEHIKFFYMLHPPTDKALHVAVMDVIESVGLQDHMHKRSKELSGGMKRRLSIANALVGDVRLLLLDEPTTGLDPESRREIWDIISVAGQGRSTIVSTHNMEEADVLCTRIGIMSQGRLVCLGNQQYLKSRFGKGYGLTITVDRGTEDALIEHILGMYPNAIVNSNYCGMISFIVPQDEIQIGTLFHEMSANKRTLHIKEWGINQSSLEEVFLQIVRRDEVRDVPDDVEDVEVIA